MSVPDQLQKLFPGMSLRPALACEITPYGVLAARQDKVAGLGTQFAPIPPVALEPGCKAQNVLNRPAIVSALRTALTAVTDKGRKLAAANRALTLIVPDAAVRVLLLDFDALPAKRSETLAILRFRLRKLVPFDVEDAPISWQPMTAGAEGVRLLVLVMPRAILVEYESLVREAGFIPGVVLPSTVAAAPLVGADATLLVNRNGETLTTAILRGGDLLLHRTLNLGGPEDAAPDAPPRPPLSAEERALQDEDDIRQTVSVALAYFEDTLAAPPAEIFYIGPGTADDFSALLGEPLIAVRDLGNTPELPSRTVPRSLLAPVTGALLNV